MEEIEGENERNQENEVFQLSDDDDDDKQFDENYHLNCPSCKQLFNQAKYLPCAHSFCLQCCEKLLSNQDQIHCPTCQQITNVNLFIIIDLFILSFFS